MYPPTLNRDHIAHVYITAFHKPTQDILVEQLICPWVMNRRKKDAEKTGKYAIVQEGLKACHPGYSAKQINVIIERSDDGSWKKEGQYVQSEPCRKSYWHSTVCGFKNKFKMLPH